MKIGAIIPIGDLHRFGYQYSSERIIQHNTDFVDAVVVISSSRHNAAQLSFTNPKLTCISDHESWFKTDAAGKEVFSYDVLNQNVKRGRALLEQQGCDIVFQIHSNQYIPHSSQTGVRSMMAALLASGQPYGWLYKKYQLGNMVFNADVKVPWILNTSVPNPYRFHSDSIIDTRTNEPVAIHTGNLTPHNAEAIVDVLLNYTLKDAEELFLFTHRENLRLSNRPDEEPVFQLENWRNYIANKINKKTLSLEKPDAFGAMLVQNRLPDFCSFYFEKHYKPYGTVQKIVQLAKDVLKLPQKTI